MMQPTMHRPVKPHLDATEVTKPPIQVILMDTMTGATSVKRRVIPQHLALPVLTVRRMYDTMKVL
jgi:hypothetical protein